MSRQWTHRVVKRLRGMQGEYFDFPTARTFGTETEARAYAEAFAREQRDVCGVQIDVRARKGNGRRGELVARYYGHTYQEQVNSGTTPAVEQERCRC